MNFSRRLGAAAVATVVLAVVPHVAVAGDHERRYYFEVSQRTVSTLATDCKSIPRGRVKESATLERQTYTRGYSDGTTSTEGWEQVTTSRESIDNPHLPSFTAKGERKKLSSKGDASENWKFGRKKATFAGYQTGAPKLSVRLPSRLNRESTKRFPTKKISRPTMDDDRCTKSDTTEVTVTITTQRVE